MSYIRRVATTVSTANASNSDPARSQQRLLHSRPIISIVNRRLEASDHKSILRLAPSITSPLCDSVSCILAYRLGHVSGQSFVNQFFIHLVFPSMGAGKPSLIFPTGLLFAFLSKVASFSSSGPRTCPPRSHPASRKASFGSLLLGGNVCGIYA